MVDRRYGDDRAWEHQQQSYEWDMERSVFWLFLTLDFYVIYFRLES